MKIFDHLDFTHGYHPTFTSMCVAPWNLNSIITTQGSSERIENLVQFFTLVPSWWFGDRMMNGLLAKRFDKKLAKKYQENPGIPA
ncbi:MAG: hypothetical protein HRT47_06980 [Candidatus Caenarcaniphilales bacterium]|nr:hypothetical protein [Candidatus Caenarcaniphilales bacterium]